MSNRHVTWLLNCVIKTESFQYLFFRVDAIKKSKLNSFNVFKSLTIRLLIFTALIKLNFALEKPLTANLLLASPGNVGSIGNCHYTVRTRIFILRK